MIRFFFLAIYTLIVLTACNNSRPAAEKQDSASKDSIADPEKLIRVSPTNAEYYNQILDLLDKNDLKSVNIAIAVFQNSKADSLTLDSMLAGFNDFLSVVSANYLENNDSIKGRPGIDVNDETIDKVRSKLAHFGMNVSTSEGEVFLEPDNDFLLSNFDKRISAAYKNFLRISSAEQKIKFEDNGTMLIPVDSLCRRIIIWEDFISRYPDFVSVNRAQDNYTRYMEALLTGLDNSRVFDPDTKKLNGKIRTVYENYVSKYPGRKSASVVKDYLDLLKSSGYLYSDKIDAFILDRVFN